MNAGTTLTGFLRRLTRRFRGDDSLPIHPDEMCIRDRGHAHLENVKLLANELGLRIVAPIPFRSDVTDAQLDEIVRVIAAKKPEIFFNHGSSDISVSYTHLDVYKRQA